MMTEEQAADAICTLAAAGYATELYYRPNGTYAVHVVEPYRDLLTRYAVAQFLREQAAWHHRATKQTRS